MTMILPAATRLPSLSLLFHQRSDFAAALCIRPQCSVGTILTVLHEDFYGGVTAHLIISNADLDLAVQDGESITIMARMEGAIVGCAILEVDTDLVDSVGTLLIPRTLSNLIIDQCQAEIVQNGISAALERCRRYTTDALPDLAETAVAL